MAAAWGAAAAAAAQLAGNWIDYVGQKGVNSTNRKIAREQMAFQERMSNTAYQRAVADMKTAGLNPALAYEQGGASSPAGATATMGNPGAGMGGKMSSAVMSYLQAKQMDTDITKTDADTQLSLAQARESESKLNLNTATAQQASAQTTLIGYTANKVMAETANIKGDTQRLNETVKLLQQDVLLKPQEKVLAFDLLRAQIAKTNAEGVTAGRISKLPYLNSGQLGDAGNFGFNSGLILKDVKNSAFPDSGTRFSLPPGEGLKNVPKSVKYNRYRSTFSKDKK
jgi:hypothetical protein